MSNACVSFALLEAYDAVAGLEARFRVRSQCIATAAATISTPQIESHSAG